MSTEEQLGFEERLVNELKLIRFENDSFRGEGWEFIKSKIEEHQHILIGEDHFINEVPHFVQEIAKLAKFDNFYIEVDPYST